MTISNSKRNAGLIAALAAGAGALAVAGAFAAPASASPVPARPAAHAAPHSLTVRQIASGKKLHHKFRVDGKGAVKTETLAGPDDLGFLGGHLYVGFQNGVGSQGEPSADGNLDSTIVEFTLSGREVRQWDVKGKVDGLSADPAIGKIIATVNEDSKSSLYTVNPVTRTVTHYVYGVPLPHKGGTDAISVYRGHILVSASAPGTSAKAPANAPAVYEVKLLTPVDPGSPHVAAVAKLFADNSAALAVNGPKVGQRVKLALTDPDSSEVVPSVSPRFGGDFMLDSQGDLELIFYGPLGSLKVLTLPASIDDSAWATKHVGDLFTTDASADTLDVVLGVYKTGTMYAAVTPCNANSAPATCPAPGFPANFLGTVNLKTGAISPVKTAGAKVQPKGLIFVP